MGALFEALTGKPDTEGYRSEWTQKMELYSPVTEITSSTYANFCADDVPVLPV